MLSQGLAYGGQVRYLQATWPALQSGALKLLINQRSQCSILSLICFVFIVTLLVISQIPGKDHFLPSCSFFNTIKKISSLSFLLDFPDSRHLNTTKLKLLSLLQAKVSCVVDLLGLLGSWSPVQLVSCVVCSGSSVQWVSGLLCNGSRVSCSSGFLCSGCPMQSAVGVLCCVQWASCLVDLLCSGSSMWQVSYIVGLLCGWSPVQRVSGLLCNVQWVSYVAGLLVQRVSCVAGLLCSVQWFSCAVSFGLLYSRTPVQQDSCVVGLRTPVQWVSCAWVSYTADLLPVQQVSCAAGLLCSGSPVQQLWN